MTPAWQGEAELYIYRDDARVAVVVELFRRPAPPGKTGRWSGVFAAEPVRPLTPGRALLCLPEGAELEVMVEGYDAVTGRGDFFGLDRAPFATG